MYLLRVTTAEATSVYMGVERCSVPLAPDVPTSTSHASSYSPHWLRSCATH